MTASEATDGTPAPFDFNEPLPDLHIRQTRSWEPAARHYRDLPTEETGTA